MCEAFHSEGNWSKFWESIEGMENLKTLRVVLADTPKFFIWSSDSIQDRTWQRRSSHCDDKAPYRDILLDPLRRIRGLDEFVVELRRLRHVRVDDPFTVIYPEWVTAR